MSDDAAISIALRLVDQATAPMNEAMRQMERATAAAEQRVRSLEAASNAARKASAITFSTGDMAKMVSAYKSQEEVISRISLSALPKQAQAVEQVRRKYGQLVEETDKLERTGRITKALADQWRAGLGSRMTEDVRSLGQQSESVLGRVAGGAIAAAAAIAAMFAAVAAGGKAIFDAGISAQQLSMSFKAIGGDTATAQKEMAFVRAESDRLGQSFPQLANAYKGVWAASKGTALEGEGVRRVFSSITEASAALGLSSEQTNGALVAVGQMMSKGKIQAEELRGQLGERLPGAFSLMAESMGVSTAQLDKLLQEGKVGVDVLSGFAEVLHEKYGNAAETAAYGAMGAVNRLSGAWYDFKASLASSGFIDQVTNAMRGLAGVIKDNTGTAKEWGGEISQALKEGLDYLPVGVQAVKDLFNAIASWEEVVGVAKRLGSALANLAKSAAGLAAVLGGRLSFADFAGMNAGELDKWLKSSVTESGKLETAFKRINDQLAKEREYLAYSPEERAAKETRIAALEKERDVLGGQLKLIREQADQQERLSKATAWTLPTPYPSYSRKGTSYVGFDAMVASQVDQSSWGYSGYLDEVKKKVQSLKPDLKEWEKDQQRIADEAQRSRDQLDGLLRNLNHDQALAGLTGLEKSLKEIDQRAEEYKIQIKDLTGVDKKAAMERVDAWVKNQKAIATTADEFQQLEKQLARLDHGDKDLQSLRLDALPEQQRQLQEIADKYAEIDRRISGQVNLQQDFGDAVGLSAEEAEHLRQVYAVRMQEDIAAATEKVTGEAKVFQEIAKSIHRSFTDFFEKIFDGGVKKISDLGDSILGIFKRIFAQLAALAIAEPIVVPVIGMVGGAMGVSSSAQDGVLRQLGMNGSSLQTGVQGASLLSTLMSGYSTAANATYTWSGVQSLLGPSNASMVADPFAYDAFAAGGSWQSSLSSAFDSIPGGPGALFSAYNAFQSFSDGNEVAGAGHTAAAIAAFTGNPLLALGIELGTTLFGGMFGEGENRFTLTELDNQAAAPADRTWDRYQGFQAMGDAGLWTHGNDWYQPIQDAYVQGRDQLTTAFNQQVQTLRSSMSDEAWNAFAAALESESLDYSHEGNFYLSDAQGVIETAMRGLAGDLDSMLTTALQAALPVISEELLSSDSFAVLTDQAQQFIRDQLDTGTVESVQQVAQYFGDLTAITGQIDKAVADHDLSDYQKQINAINEQFDADAARLRARGLDLARYTALEEARAQAIADVNRANMESLQSTLAGAGRAYLDGLITERDRLQGDVDTARTKYLDLLTQEHDRLDQLSDTLLSSINSIRNARRDLYSQATGMLPAGQQLTAIRSEIDRQRAIIAGGDPEKVADALSQIQSLAGEYDAVSKSLRTSWIDRSRDLSYLNDLLDTSEQQAVTMRDSAETEAAGFQDMIDAVNGNTDAALTIDQARQAYETAVLELERSGLDTQISYLERLYGSSRNLERLLTDYLDALSNEGQGVADAGQSGQVVTIPGTTSQTYTSTAGATAVWPSSSSGWSDVTILGKNGAVFNAQAEIDQVVSLIGATANDPAAREAAVRQIVAASNVIGITSRELDVMLGLDSGTSSTVAQAYGIHGFATGGSFMASGPGGVDNLSLPGLRVSAGEMVHVTRPDTMASLAEEIRELRRALATVLKEGNDIALNNLVNTGQIAKVFKRHSGVDGIKVTVENTANVAVVGTVTTVAA